MSYGENHEEELVRPTSPRVVKKLRTVKEFHDVCLTMQTPVIDHRVPLRYNEAVALPPADL